MTPVFSKAYLNSEGVPEVTPEDAQENLKIFEIIDVRRPDEFNAELGHIAGAKLATLGPELIACFRSLAPDKNYLFVCRAGARSSTATALAKSQGLANSYNLKGGMLLWNEKGLAVQRSP